MDDGVQLPASNMTMELDLISWKSIVDITGDKKVVKKITKTGEGFDHPNEGSFVKGMVSHEPDACQLPNSAKKIL